MYNLMKLDTIKLEIQTEFITPPFFVSNYILIFKTLYKSSDYDH